MNSPPGSDRAKLWSFAAGWCWIKRLASVGTKQAVIQGIGFASGILIVRQLPATDYALYTLAYAALGTMAVLADGGISSGVMAAAGRAWTDRVRLGAIISTGLRLRQRFAVLSLVVCVPVVLVLFRRHDASWPYAISLALGVAVSFWFVLAASVHSVASALHQKLDEIQHIAILQNLGRLGGLAGVLFAVPAALAVVAVTAVAQGWAASRLKRLSDGLADPAQPEDPAVRLEILQMVKRMLPSSIYYCLSGQITIWVIALFGNTTAVAQVGALGRFGQVFAAVSGFSSLVIIPRFARLEHNDSRMVRRYFQALLGLALIGSLLLLAAMVFPNETLWVLGPKYRGLTGVLALQLAGSVLGMLTGAAHALGCARKCVISPRVIIPVDLAWQVACLLLLKVGTLHGVLCYGILIAAQSLVMHVGYFVWWARREAASRREDPHPDRRLADGAIA